MSGRSRHHEHFRSSHRHSMSVAKIDQSRFTQHEGNGSRLAAKTLQETVLRTRETWWAKLFKWETDLTVGNKTIEKGWVIPQQLGIALIVLILSGIAGLYWTMSSRIDAKDNAYQEQRDMLIEIKTELKIRKEHDDQRFQKLETEFQSVHAWQQVTNREMAKIQLRGSQQ